MMALAVAGGCTGGGNCGAAADDIAAAGVADTAAVVERMRPATAVRRAGSHRRYFDESLHDVGCVGVVVVVVGRVGVVWAFGDLYFKTLAFDGETIEALNRNFCLMRGLELDEAVT